MKKLLAGGGGRRCPDTEPDPRSEDLEPAPQFKVRQGGRSYRLPAET